MERHSTFQLHKYAKIKLRDIMTAFKLHKNVAEEFCLSSLIA